MKITFVYFFLSRVLVANMLSVMITFGAMVTRDAKAISQKKRIQIMLGNTKCYALTISVQSKQFFQPILGQISGLFSNIISLNMYGLWL